MTLHVFAVKKAALIGHNQRMNLALSSRERVSHSQLHGRIAYKVSSTETMKKRSFERKSDNVCQKLSVRNRVSQRQECVLPQQRHGWQQLSPDLSHKNRIEQNTLAMASICQSFGPSCSYHRIVKIDDKHGLQAVRRQESCRFCHLVSYKGLVVSSHCAILPIRSTCRGSSVAMPIERYGATSMDC